MNDRTTKIMENAALGEALCSALLLERFWVMKRSVDTDGGDFLIQLRDTTAKLTDLLPPRIGTVQSKFSQNEKTSHKIPMSYVVDSTGEPLRGFFLIVHLGQDERRRRFVLTSSEIKSSLPLKTKEGNSYYVVGASAYSSRFEFNTQAVALDKIENDLTKRSEEDKRRFMQSVLIPDYELKRTNLGNFWLLPIPNEHAYIADEVYRIKSSLKLALYAYDNIQKLIGDILFSQDAEDCVQLLDQLRESYEVDELDDGYYLKPYQYKLNISKTLGLAVATHRSRYNQLEALDRVGVFLELSRRLLVLCVDAFKKLEPTKRQISKSSFTFDPVKFTIGIRLDTVTMGVISVESANELAAGYDIQETGEIFADWEDGRISGWRDMHRLQDRVMAKYFRILCPNEVVGEPKQTVLMMV